MRKFYGFALFFLLSFSGVFTCLAQQYNFRVYTAQDGLVQAQINCIYQDNNGLIWLGTNGGLSSFDGRRFTNYSLDHGLPGSKVIAVTQDNEQNLWVICENKGIARFDGKKFFTYNQNSGLLSNDAKDLAIGPNGNTWIATFNGVSRWDGAEFFDLNDQNGLDNTYAQAILCDDDGNIWVGTYGGGLFRFQEGQSIRYTTATGLPGNYITCLEKNERGELLVGTTSGFSRFDGQYFNNIGPEEGLASFQVTSISEDKKGYTWLGTYDGISVLKGDEITNIGEMNGLPGSQVNGLLVDREGNLWVATNNGLACLYDLAFRHYGKDDGLNGIKVTRIFKDSKGNILAGNEGGGVYQLKDERFIPFNIDEDLSSHYISAIAEDGKGNLWFGTMDFGGVYKYEGNRVINYTEESGLPDNIINDMISDKEGNIWLATDFGVARYSQQLGFETLSISEERNTNRIMSIHEDHFGNIWLGTYSGVVCKIIYEGLRPGEFEIRTFTEEEGLKSAPVKQVVQDKTGHLFFRVEGEGVMRFSNGVPDFITTNDGLSSNNVHSLVFDHMGVLWAGTQNGLNRINIDNNEKLEIKYFGREDGFVSIECNDNASLYDRLGNLWFGTMDGVTKLNPAKLHENYVQPQIAITDLLLFFKEVDWHDYAEDVTANGLPIGLTLPYDQNYLMFNFIAASYTSPEKVRYQWMLEGLDRDWVPPSDMMEANYPNLPPGEYTFKLRACNNEGLWNEKPVEYSFVITPPFWKTTWFYAALSGSLLLMFFGYVKWREMRLVKEKEELERVVLERTEEIREQKSVIEEKNIHIMESITYAKNIQMAILPSHEELRKAFSDFFVFYKPKDIVGGDFYWYYKNGNDVFVAAVDCTGHGVAGAFMSMIGSDLLNHIIIEDKVTDPARVLKELNDGLKLAFMQSAKEFDTAQGMDIVLMRLDLETQEAEFAGALRPAYIVSNGELNEVEGDKFPISGMIEGDYTYNNRRVKLNKGDMIYMASDGYSDQFGGPKGKKYMTGRFKKFLVGISNLPVEEQEQTMAKDLTEWQGDTPQIDDILVMGIRVS